MSCCAAAMQNMHNLSHWFFMRPGYRHCPECATPKRGDHRARGPGHALPQLTSLGIGGRVGREQHAVAELAQGRIRRQWLLLEGIDGGAADAPLVDGARE